MNWGSFLHERRVIIMFVLEIFTGFTTRSHMLVNGQRCIPEDAHGVQRKVWADLDYGAIDELKRDPKYPNNPTILDYITTFEAPRRFTEKYGQTLSAYFITPETGDHVFYVACDDQCQLMISGNTVPESAQVVVNVQFYTPYRKWEGSWNEASNPIYMVEGQLYYIHAIMAQHRGSEHLSVGVKLPSGLYSRPMTSNYLLKYPLKDIISLTSLRTWAKWTPCSGKCERGLETRSRFCLNSSFSYSIKRAMFTQMEKRVCQLENPCPSPPQQITIQTQDHSSIRITWLPFTFNSSILVHYKLTYTKTILLPKRKRTRRESPGEQPNTAFSHVVSKSDEGSDVTRIIILPRRKRTRRESPGEQPSTVFSHVVSKSDKDSDIIIPPSFQSIVLHGLDAVTNYCIRMAAVTIYWESQPSACVNITTAEHIPSMPPTNVTAMNQTGPDKILITWSSVPDRAQNGIIQGYKVNISRLATANIKLVESKNWTIIVNSSYMETMVSGLDSYTLYEIRVAAFTSIGTGPYCEPVYTETCRCSQTLYTNWYKLSPLAIYSTPPKGTFPTLLRDAIDSICGLCQAHKRTVIDFYRSNSNETFSPALKRSLNEVKKIIISSDISFPLGIKKNKELIEDHFRFVPALELSAGVVYINRKLSADVYAKMVGSSVFQCWPIVLLIAVLSLLAGTILCILETISYPLRTCYMSSFLKGVYEYTWCAFVSMTTVGYGDLYPRSFQGRIFTLIWLIVGMVILSIFVATVSSSLSVKIVVISKNPVQGGQVGVVKRTPEHKVAMTINGTKGIQCREYLNIHEMLQDLNDGTIDGILLDALTSDNLNESVLPPSLFQVAKTFDLEMNYGIGLSRDAIKLEQLFIEYLKKHPVKLVSNKETPKKNSSLLGEMVNQPQTPTNSPKKIKEMEINFFDPSNTLYKKTLFFTSGFLVGVTICGLFYHHLTSRKKLVGKSKQELVEKCRRQITTQELIADQRELLRAFYFQFLHVAEQLREKHRKEQQLFFRRSVGKQNSHKYCLIPIRGRQHPREDLPEHITPKPVIKHHREFVENGNKETVL